MFNWVDLLVVVIVAFYLWRGWREGFIRIGVDVVGLGLIVWAGLRFYRPVGAWLAATFEIPLPFSTAFGFLVAGIVAASLWWVLTSLAFGRLPAAVHRHWVVRLLGLLPGLAAGLLVAALAVSFLSLSPFGVNTAARVDASALGEQLVGWTTGIERRLQPVFSEAIAETLTFMTVRPESDEFVDLPFRVTEPRVAPSLEEQMLVLVNQERAAAGLAPLVMDERLRAVARDHARDMFQRGYFSHYTPERASPFDRLRVAGIGFLAAGENLALAPGLDVAHRGLMSSPGHRANILSPSFRRVGIGAMDGGLRGIMFSQEFSN